MSKIRLNSAAVYLLPHMRLFHHFSSYSFQRNTTNLEIQFLPYESESVISVIKILEEKDALSRFYSVYLKFFV